MKDSCKIYQLQYNNVPTYGCFKREKIKTTRFNADMIPLNLVFTPENKKTDEYKCRKVSALKPHLLFTQRFSRQKSVIKNASSFFFFFFFFFFQAVNCRKSYIVNAFGIISRRKLAVVKKLLKLNFKQRTNNSPCIAVAAFFGGLQVSLSMAAKFC